MQFIIEQREGRTAAKLKGPRENTAQCYVLHLGNDAIEPVIVPVASLTSTTILESAFPLELIRMH